MPSSNNKDVQKLFNETRDIVMTECRIALESIETEQVADYLKFVLSAEKVFFVGVGRVLLSLKAISKRYNHIGISAHVVGDINEPAITKKDIIIVGSGSGNSIFPVEIAKKAKELGAKVVHIGSNKEGRIKESIDLFIRIPVQTKVGKEDEISSTQPMTSLFEQTLLLFGDITSKMILDMKEIELDSLWKYHANLE